MYRTLTTMTIVGFGDITFESDAGYCRSRCRDISFSPTSARSRSVIIERAVQAEVPSVLIVDDVSEAGLLHDEGHHVMVKALDDPTPSAPTPIPTCRCRHRPWGLLTSTWLR